MTDNSDLQARRIQAAVDALLNMKGDLSENHSYSEIVTTILEAAASVQAPIEVLDSTDGFWGAIQTMKHMLSEGGVFSTQKEILYRRRIADFERTLERCRSQEAQQ